MISSVFLHQYIIQHFSEVIMKKILENILQTMPDIEFIQIENTPKIEDIQKAETFIRIYVDKLFDQNFYEINNFNGRELRQSEIIELKEQLTCRFLVDWLNKHFNADLDPVICYLLMNGTRYHN